MKVHQLKKLIEQLDGSLDVNIYYPPYSTMYDLGTPEEEAWLINTQRIAIPIIKNNNSLAKPENKADLNFEKPKKRRRKKK